MPSYSSPLTYSQTFTAFGQNLLAQCSYDGGANAYAFTRYIAPDGRWFGRAEVRQSDPGISADIAAGRDRSEIQVQAKLARGAHWWMSVSFKIASPLVPTGSFQQLLQIHGTANTGQAGGSSLFALELKTSTKALQLRRRSNATGLDADYTDWPLMWVDSSPVVTDRWYHLVVEIVEGWSNDGICNAWLDGVQIVNLSGINIGYNDTTGPYWKLGLYRGGSATDTLAVEYANPEFKDDGTSLFSRVASPLSTADGGYVLTASPGAFHTGGSGASFFINRRLQAQSGSFTAAGSANFALGTAAGDIKVAKQVGYALVLGPSGLKASKQVAYAQLVYPKIDVAKQVDYANLNRASVQVGKQVVYALLRLPPAAEEVEIDFTASASLDLTYAVDPELTVFVSLDFRASASLGITVEREPPFGCEVPETTTWANASPVTTSWNCPTGSTTTWACAGEQPTSNDVLVDVAGTYLTYLNGDRIRLI